MHIRIHVCLLVCLAAISTWPTAQGFNLGVKDTKCNLDPSKGEVTDPCRSLYDGICGGKYCKCGPGTHEDPGLKRCVPGEAPKTSSGGTHAAGGGDLFDDIPWDYDPNKKTTPKPSAPGLPPPQRPPPQPQPGPPPHPQPGYPGQPQPHPPPHPQPGYPGQPQPGYPGQPQPGYPGQPQPGYPGQPQQPRPTQPGYRPGHSGNKGNDNIGEKAGGGVGGVVGLLIIGGLIYFCCCRGGKGKEMMNKFGGGRFQGIPFMRGGQQAAPGAAVQMQQSVPVQQDPNFGSQHTYVPPGGGAPVNPGQYPPQQPYPPQGYAPEGQQPPPYTPQYQPNAPPPQ